MGRPWLSWHTCPQQMPSERREEGVPSQGENPGRARDGEHTFLCQVDSPGVSSLFISLLGTHL